MLEIAPGDEVTYELVRQDDLEVLDSLLGICTRTVVKSIKGKDRLHSTSPDLESMLRRGEYDEKAVRIDVG
jgi:hypothetical protein